MWRREAGTATVAPMQPDNTNTPAVDDESPFGVLDGPDGPAYTPPVTDADRAAVDAAVVRVEQLDRDGDGSVSLREAVQGHLTALDDVLVEYATTPGAIGGTAELLHRVVDRFDGDGAVNRTDTARD